MPVSKSKRKKKASRGRKRPPAPKVTAKSRRPKRWVPYAFFTLMGVGVLIIILNYFLIFGEFQNWLLFVGLGLMGAAFAVATQWY